MRLTSTYAPPWEWLNRHGSWLGFAAEILVLLLAAWMVRRVVLGYLAAWAKKTGRTFDEQIVGVVGAALIPLLILAAIAVTVNSLPVPQQILALCNRIFTLSMVAIALFYTYRAVMITSSAWIARDTTRESLMDSVSFFIRVLFAGMAVTLLLDNLGVSLKAVWTTLGVGSVAIALALQDTLSNFFAGVYLRIDRPVRVGDYIKLESNHEGYVEQLGWRSTRIKTLSNNVVVVPNAKLSSATLTNFSLPEARLSLSVPISVSYDADLEHIEAILVEEAKAAAEKVEGLLATPEPSVSLIPGFGDYALNLTLGYSVASYVDQYRAQDEIRKRILARFRAEGISIPFPQRDVHVYPNSNSKEWISEFAGGTRDSSAA